MLFRSRSRRNVAWLALVLSVALPARSEAAAVHGTVVDRDGKPAAGAKVRLVSLPPGGPLRTHDLTSDDQGAFAVDLDPGIWAAFALRGEEGGRASWAVTIPEQSDGQAIDPVRITLGPPTTLKGRLLDAQTGEPIREGSVHLDDARRIDVDADGRFEASGLEMGNHRAGAVAPGYAALLLVYDTTLRPNAELDMRLERGGSVVGRIVDPDGKPIPGASVGSPASASLFVNAGLGGKSDADGRYVYRNQPLGKLLQISARAPGYQDSTRRQTAVPDADHPAELNFTLLPGVTVPAVSRGSASPIMESRTLSGRVSSGGKPVAGASVRWGMTIVDSNSVPEVKTDSEGKFTLEDVPDTTNVLSVIAKGFVPRFPLADGKGDQTINVELKPGAKLRGRVLDDEGNPIEGARVSPLIDRPQPEWGDFRPFASTFVYLRDLVTETDADGVFTLEEVPEGAKCDVIAKGRSAVRRRGLSTDESKNVITLSGEGAIRGRVVDFLGNPVRNFRVKIDFPKERKPGDEVGGYSVDLKNPGVTFTRDDGVFTVSFLTAGNVYRLTVQTETQGSFEVDRVVADPLNHLKPAEDFTITLNPPHILRVRVVREGAEPLAGAVVTAIPTESIARFRWFPGTTSWEESVKTTTDERGWAEFSTLTFETGTVAVQAPGFARACLMWADHNDELLAILEPAATLEGKVTDAAGKPFTEGKIQMMWGLGEQMDVAIDPGTGHYSAAALPSGSFRFSVISKAGLSVYSDRIHLHPGEIRAMDIRLPPPAP